MAKYSNEWRSHLSFLCTGCLEEINGALKWIRIALHVATEMRETLQKHEVMTVAVFSNSQAAIR